MCFNNINFVRKSSMPSWSLLHLTTLPADIICPMEYEQKFLWWVSRDIRGLDQLPLKQDTRIFYLWPNISCYSFQGGLPCFPINIFGATANNKTEINFPMNWLDQMRGWFACSRKSKISYLCLWNSYTSMRWLVIVVLFWLFKKKHLLPEIKLLIKKNHIISYINSPIN